MKRFTLALTALSLCGTALMYAGQEAISSSSKEMKEVAPMPPPCPTFGGFYLGMTGGFKHADTDVSVHFNDDFFPGPDVAKVVHDHGDADLDPNGGEFGGVLGYNYQTKSNFVFGLEAAGGWIWLHDSKVTHRFTAPDDNEFHVSTSFDSDYIFTAGGRVGYAFCRWLPYVTGGLAIGNNSFEQVITRHRTVSHTPFFEGGNEDDTNIGWMVGGGVEYAFAKHWRVRAQYQYIDLGDSSFNHDANDHIHPPVRGEVEPSRGHSDVELREHNASVSLIYNFAR